MARSRCRCVRFDAFLDQLRTGDPTFAEASALYPNDMGECQAAAYLLTGCDAVWRAGGSPHRPPGRPRSTSLTWRGATR